MKYPDILKERLKTEYWQKFEKLKIDCPRDKTNQDIYFELEETMPYYSTYGSFRKGLHQYRKSLKKKRK